MRVSGILIYLLKGSLKDKTSKEEAYVPFFLIEPFIYLYRYIKTAYIFVYNLMSLNLRIYP